MRLTARHCGGLMTGATENPNTICMVERERRFDEKAESLSVAFEAVTV